MRDDAPVDPSSQHYCDAALMVRDGRIGRGSAKSRIPASDVLVTAGQCSPGDLKQAADSTVATVEKCAPWVVALLVPRLRSNCSGYQYLGKTLKMLAVKLGGLASYENDQPTLMVSMDRSLEGIRKTLHHEVWHQIENLLDADGNRTLTEALGPYGYSAGGDGYTQSASERLARAYSYYAMQADDLCDHGAPLPVAVEGPLKVGFKSFVNLQRRICEGDTCTRTDLARTACVPSGELLETEVRQLLEVAIKLCVVCWYYVRPPVTPRWNNTESEPGNTLFVPRNTSG